MYCTILFGFKSTSCLFFFLKYSGGSAAESGIFQVLDAVLGVIHLKDAGIMILIKKNGMQEWHTLTNFDHLGEWEGLLSVKTGPTVYMDNISIGYQTNRDEKSKFLSFSYMCKVGSEKHNVNNIFFSFSFLALNIHWITSHIGSLFSKKIWPSFFLNHMLTNLAATCTLYT